MNSAVFLIRDALVKAAGKWDRRIAAMIRRDPTKRNQLMSQLAGFDMAGQLEKHPLSRHSIAVAASTNRDMKAEKNLKTFSTGMSSRIDKNAPNASSLATKLENKVQARQSALDESNEAAFNARKDNVSRAIRGLFKPIAGEPLAFTVPSGKTDQHSSATWHAPVTESYNPERFLYRGLTRMPTVEGTKDTFATPHPGIAAGYAATSGIPLVARFNTPEDSVFSTHQGKTQRGIRLAQMRGWSHERADKYPNVGNDPRGRLPDYETVVPYFSSKDITDLYMLNHTGNQQFTADDTTKYQMVPAGVRSRGAVIPFSRAAESKGYQRFVDYDASLR